MAVEMQTDDFPYLPSGLAEVNKMIKEHSDLFSDSQCKVCSAVLISESQKLTHYQSKKHANKVRRYLSSQNEKEPAVKKFKSPSESDCNNGDSDRSKACHLCDMTFSSPVMAESHYQGKVHAKHLRLKTFGPQAPVASQTPPTAQPKKKPADDSSGMPAMGGNNNNPDRFCSICQASFNNPLMAQQHYVGKKHRKQMTKLKLMETYGPSTAPGQATEPASTVKGYPCTVCNLELNSVEQYHFHISGAKHKNQVKKSRRNTAENQDAAEQPYEADNQSAGGDNLCTAADDQYAPGDDQYAPGDDQYAPGDDQYTPGDDQYAPGDDQYALADDTQYVAEDNQYAPEDTEYSEEDQFT
ncbi:zinc finger protein 346 isoform X2 [Plectropomus leopardus]|uniref:zinc finger protein 346 isoform X2 n=1 Tax=Plectropomus leopardus TaxID=160734 RepID=UPI001C4CB3D6|nr:zinc finger protein 346 isoform X2 [Plectropomus leopardus]